MVTPPGAKKEKMSRESSYLVKIPFLSMRWVKWSVAVKIEKWTAEERM